MHTRLFTNTGTYRYAVAACKFVKASQVGLTLVVRIALLVGVV